MDTRARLARISSLRGPAAGGSPSDRPAPQPGPAGASSGATPLESLVAGAWREGARGCCFVTEERYALAYRHGVTSLGEVLSVPPRAWTAHVAGLGEEGFAPERALYLDIETTGLSRDAGTYAFLVGAGFFAGDEYIVRQYFMPDYADEEALLELLADDLTRAAGLVTFNGRAFDWPIIEARYVLSRRQPPVSGAPHLDLLPLARRLWKRTRGCCALSALEGSVLGVERGPGDVPGYLIPAIYTDYLRTGAAGPLVDVFYHNLVDVLSLAALAGLAGRTAAERFAPREDLPCDCLSLAALYEREGRLDEAVAAYREASAPGADPRFRAEAARRLSYLLKRLARYDEAMDVWRSVAEEGALYAYVELAMQYEHRLKDFPAACDVVRRGLEWIASPACPLGRYEARQARRDLEHRLARLARRMGPS